MVSSNRRLSLTLNAYFLRMKNAGIYPSLTQHPTGSVARMWILNRFQKGWSDQPNQLTRLDSIEPQAAYLNKIYTDLLASIGSVFANYVLVSTQWPLHGRNAAGKINTINCAENATGQDCFTMKPRFLRNTVIENYMSTYCSSNEQNVQLSNRSCMSCHGTAGNDFSYIWLDAVSQRVAIK